MQRNAGNLFIFLLILFPAAGFMRQPSAAASIVCVGNSITAGSKLPDTTKRYPTLLLQRLGTTYISNSIVNFSSPVSVNNAGVSGRTLLKNGTQPYWIEPAFSRIFTQSPAVITIMLGTNDTKPVNWLHYASSFEPDCAAMVDTFSTIASKPKIILCIPPPIFKVRSSASDTVTHSDSTMVDGVIPKIRSVAKTKGLKIIDARTPFLDKKALFADSLHPDATGHKMLADIFYEGILNHASDQLYKISLLWYGDAPGVIGAGTDTSSKPMLHVYPASGGSNTHAAILVCPGGGYGHIALYKEGDSVGQWFASNGVTAFVLRYRFKPYYYPIPFNDAKRAMRLVRYHAATYGIDTSRIGIMGFSAGGHLASLVGTRHYDNGDPAALDPIETKKSKPDFMALIYPVITLTGQHVHTGSRDSLLGTSTAPSAALLDSLSSQKWVNSQTPPTFLAHGSADNSVPIQNSMMFDSACAANGVPHKFMTDPGMGHGYGLAGTWPDTLIRWMHDRGITASTGSRERKLNVRRAPAQVFLKRTADNRIIFTSENNTPFRLSVCTLSGKRVVHFISPTGHPCSWKPTAEGVYVLSLSCGGMAGCAVTFR
ncbi:MAG: alpha/beta hydrolase fold domain-containing protein [Chitinispirillaceae bacterium]|nr:alpha/beta hydrolase fold domain-containing protein [Chitinispirillaceae bacterium]